MSRLYKDGLRLKLVLNKRERKTLTHIRARSDKAYQRERAAALLKISDGISPHCVALSGLLRQRDPDTVYRWVYAFDACGFLSLPHAPRRLKDSLTPVEKKQLEKAITQQSPQDYSFSRSRWTLKTLRDALPFLKAFSFSGVWKLLKRLRIHYKRSLDSVPCPDAKKAEKIRRIRALLGYARKHESVVLLFLDEFSFYRQPLCGPAWWPCGRQEQPKAKRSRNANTRGRVVAALNAVDGRLVYRMASKINLPCFCDFLRQIKERYPDAEQIYLVLDNWLTVHKHEKAMETFKETSIVPVFLPTYSPQSNPIELLWEQLNNDVLRLHRDSDDWATLKQRVCTWLDTLSQPSQRAIEMVGLKARPAIRMNAA